ncbi:MAG: acetolactate synthase large subunit [Rhodospirillaceae bacterium]|jgi:acetolactate synthase-1/2/3 large subunit|nr:acetolactate synthase large subunit [Rhodospirillaceae bacterium]MBT5945169.1 acetolactate synthase large subunit [Rhodospirillaceae bacterium]MBT6402838.1 acetolactate synthase large subunit [Rhodospirillaceae bacterium]MBT6534812.1 acetolactate synthase large subunit [Rhodospirillaceae bacterium]MBT7360945.1 acetolactate synthase large subunit [Rhodospirillaceae bacterium]
MNGAESLVKTLLAGGVDVCFANPGTSEMHFVAALDKIPGMRCVLGLFEGVVTGAADGYYRMADKPASTLLHLGPGLANGLANLHNAKKADSGIVNIVGEHATYHIEYNAPLTSDIEGLARPMSHWVRTSPDAQSVAADGAAAIQAANAVPGQIATLILPADTAWSPAETVAETQAASPPTPVSQDAVIAAAKMLRSGNKTTLMLGGRALRSCPLELVGRIVAKTGCGVLTEWSNTRFERGAGRIQINRIPYPVDKALPVMRDAGDLVLVGAREPVAFFAYPDKPSRLMPDDAHTMELADNGADIEAALEALADELEARSTPPAQIAEPRRPDIPQGPNNPATIAAVLGNRIPENAIVVDESVSTGRDFFLETAGAPPHDWLNNRGGSIGYGLPVAVGAAIACPDRKVILLQSDGSGMYTVQSLWTMARENLDITVLVFANNSYNILRGELTNVGVQNPGPRAIDMLSLDRPTLDWVSLAHGMGVEAMRADDAPTLAKAFDAGLASEGTFLIQVNM